MRYDFFDDYELARSIAPQQCGALIAISAPTEYSSELLCHAHSHFMHRSCLAVQNAIKTRILRKWRRSYDSLD
jgi:hypothetical protein